METACLSAESLGSTSILCDYTKCRHYVFREKGGMNITMYSLSGGQSHAVFLLAVPHTLIAPSLSWYPPSLISHLSPLFHIQYIVSILRKKNSSYSSEQGERLGSDAGPTKQRVLFIPHRSADAFSPLSKHSPYSDLHRWMDRCVSVCVCLMRQAWRTWYISSHASP